MLKSADTGAGAHTTDDAAADALADALADAVADAVTDALADAAGLFSFFMHLVVLICSSISHMIARLLVDSVAFEDVAFCAHFCS